MMETLTFGAIPPRAIWAEDAGAGLLLGAPTNDELPSSAGNIDANAALVCVPQAVGSFNNIAPDRTQREKQSRAAA